MRPSSHHQARQQVRAIMNCKVSGRDNKNKKILIRTYENIVVAIWKEWKIGLYQLRPQHISWYLTEGLETRSTATRYRHWRRIAEMMVVIEKYDVWESSLRGPWRNPAGQPFSLNKAGRKPKIGTKSRNDEGLKAYQ